MLRWSGGSNDTTLPPPARILLGATWFVLNLLFVTFEKVRIRVVVVSSYRQVFTNVYCIIFNNTHDIYMKLLFVAMILSTCAQIYMYIPLINTEEECWPRFDDEELRMTHKRQNPNTLVLSHLQSVLSQWESGFACFLYDLLPIFYTMGSTDGELDGLLLLVGELEGAFVGGRAATGRMTSLTIWMTPFDAWVFLSPRTTVG